MKTKYVCQGLISLYVNFHNNRTMWSTNLLVKICRGGKEKEPTRRLYYLLYSENVCFSIDFCFTIIGSFKHFFSKQF